MPDLMNRQIADRLEEAACLLREQRADPFRVNAYLRAASSARHWPAPLRDVFRDRDLPDMKREDVKANVRKVEIEEAPKPAKTAA